MTHLVLVLVLAAAVQSGACPPMCTCGDSLLIAACDAFSANITALLDAATRDLTFANLDPDQLQTVVADLLEEIRLPHLAQLTITRSVLPDLINLTLPRLRAVSLSANSITELPDSFLNITALQSLDLSNNSLVAIRNAPFRTLHNLELLNLSGNFLTLIGSDSFSGLAALKCLDLSGNNLTHLADTVFTPLLSLQHLNLSQNRLEALDERCFTNLVKLQQLDLSWNHLVELGSLQLPSLSRLLLAGNAELGKSRELLVGTGQRLQTVDASQIGLKQVPAALTHSIRTLRLAGNGIKTVRCGDLDSYPLVQLLDLTSNGLQLVEDDALGRLDSLSILYLANNTMTEIPRSLSEKLKVLHLEHNKIEKICRKDLQGLAALEVLLLNDNNISVIEEEAFNQLGALVTLDISRNPIKVLEAGCLSGSMVLQVLRLSSIGVSSPAKEVSFPLSSTEHLVTLDLSGSPGLARQLLADTAALAAARELQELDLSDTGLEDIRSDLLHFLPQLRIFRIGGNRINCTQLQWLAAWMRRQDETEYKKIACESPPELWGTLLIDLQEISDDLPAPFTEHDQVDFKDLQREEETTENIAELENNQTVTTMSSTESLTEISTDLFTEGTTFTDSNSSDGQGWNVSTGEMSMFSAGHRRGRLLHPGMLVLVAGALGAAAVLTMLAARFTKRRPARGQDVEVGSLPGVTELW